MGKHKLIDNEARKCYEFNIDGLVPKVDYIKTSEGDLYLTHTEVPSQLQGQGVGKELVVAILEEADSEGWKVIPLCGFVAGYIRKNPEWKRLLKEGVNVG